MRFLSPQQKIPSLHPLDLRPSCSFDSRLKLQVVHLRCAPVAVDAGSFPSLIALRFERSEMTGKGRGDRYEDRWDRRDFRGDRWDRRGDWDRGGWGFAGGPRAAVDRCVRAAENQARRFGGYRFADVIDVRDIDRTRDGFRVRGRIDVGGGWNRSDRGRFTCRIDGRGAPLIDFDGIRGLR